MGLDVAGAGLQDLVYARRILCKDVGFTLIAVISLALGVGANCAMFSFADVLLLRPLPVPRPSEPLNLGSESTKDTAEEMHLSYPDYIDFRDRNRSFSELAAFEITSLCYSKEPDAPVELGTGAIVTADFFSAMQVQPVLGRGLLTGGRPSSRTECSDDSEPYVLGTAVCFGCGGGGPNHPREWHRFHHRRRDVRRVHRTRSFRPPRFLRADDDVASVERRSSGPAVAARSEDTGREGSAETRSLSQRQAEAEAASIGSSLATEYRQTNENVAGKVKTDLQQRLQESGPTGMILAMLMLLALAVLVVACANVAGLLASKAPARARERSLRLAIGAGRGRIVRQLLTESLILALLGAAGGVAVGYAGIRLMSQMTIVADVAVALSFELDYRVLAFGLATAVASVFLFGLGPALRSARTDLTESLRMRGSQSAQSKQWIPNILVTNQMVLLTVASLMFQTFRRDLLAGPGFRSDNVLMAAFNPSLVNYDHAKTRDFYRQLPERMRSLPGVRSVALASMVPANYNYETMPIAPERYQLPEGQQTVAILTSRVDENYFGTLQVPPMRGRGFAATDVASSPSVAVLNETAAAQFWPGQDAIGKRIRMGNDWLEVAGVAKTGKYRFLMERPAGFLYVPYAQHPRSSMLLLESAGDLTSLAVPLRTRCARWMPMSSWTRRTRKSTHPCPRPDHAPDPYDTWRCVCRSSKH